uniref:Uncharacterized protein n=1 Tax=viral metagenome TaxID=1070528 RepID=A0A6C0K8H2_9ZZZZ
MVLEYEVILKDIHAISKNISTINIKRYLTNIFIASLYLYLIFIFIYY